MLTVAKNICLDISKTKMSLRFDNIASGVSNIECPIRIFLTANLRGQRIVYFVLVTSSKYLFITGVSSLGVPGVP